MTEVSDDQRRRWLEAFCENPALFGEKPSDAARFAAAAFKKEGLTRILELGGGQGRDTLYFARRGFRVHMLDCADEAVRSVTEKMRKQHLSDVVSVRRHDVRPPLPFADESFDGCYSHMLFCMALTTPELAFLSREVRRVLRPEGLHIYTVRHTGDAHYRTGIHRGEDIYEVDGFAVHFFSRKKVEQLAEGDEIIRVDEFEEGELPRRLFIVTLRKKRT